jgi:hypothetical protein
MRVRAKHPAGARIKPYVHAKQARTAE